MTPDDMARELRAAGWRQEGNWWHSGAAPHVGAWPLSRAHAVMMSWKELAQQRERGTVQTPVVGTEDER